MTHNSQNIQKDQKKSPKVAFILKGYPRLSETFIAQEIRNLEKRGLEIEIISLRHPTDKKTHPIHQEIEAHVSYLPEYLRDERQRVVQSWDKVRKLPGYAYAFQEFLKDFKRDKTANRIRRFGQACVLAAELAPSIERIHFHFLHTPASVARYAAMIRQLPWSGSAHAKDIWTIPKWEKQEKLAQMDWLSTCTAYGAAHLREISKEDEKEKVKLIYHGLDLERFDDFPREIDQKDGSSPEKSVTLLSVGRLVKKKGYDDLLHALSLLPADLHWSLIQIGGGSLQEELIQLAAKLGLSENITWLGAQSQDQVLKNMCQSDAFILVSKVTEDGDRDGLPNVLMEAQSQSLAVVSTNISAIPELIVENVNGLLAEAESPENLSTKIKEIIKNPQKRFEMGQAGNHRVRTEFNADICITRLAESFHLNTDLTDNDPSLDEQIAS